MELELEREAQEVEKQERLKEREETKFLIEGFKQSQNLLLSIRDENTDEEISYEVKRIAKSQQ